jgi:hypothetical protein
VPDINLGRSDIGSARKGHHCNWRPQFNLKRLGNLNQQRSPGKSLSAGPKSFFRDPGQQAINAFCASACKWPRRIPWNTLHREEVLPTVITVAASFFLPFIVSATLSLFRTAFPRPTLNQRLYHGCNRDSRRNATTYRRNT